MSNARGRIFVDSSVQGALVRRILLHWFAFCALAVICLFTLEYFTGDPGLSLGGHLAVIWGKYAFFLLLMIALIPSFVYDTMKLSHRFAGPVLRLKDSIRKLAEGEAVNELKFRDNDFWIELSTDFNRVVNRVNNPQA